MDYLQLLPGLLRQLTHALAGDLVAVQLQDLQVGPLLKAELLDALVGEQAAAEEESFE